MNNDKLLTLVMRGRDFDKTRCRVCGWPLKQTVEEGCTTESCSMRPAPQRRADEPPDFSLPSHRDEFFTWLTKERPEMWEGFRRFSFNTWLSKEGSGHGALWCLSDEARSLFEAWLFFSDPARPRDLMAEWLQLDSTIRRFGYEQGELTVEAAWDDGDWGTGKCTVLSEWAKLAKEGKE